LSRPTWTRPRAAGFALALLGVACGAPDSGDAEHPAPAPRSLEERVTFAPADSATEVVLITLPGEVVLPPGASRALGPPLPGVVVEVLVAVGDVVEEGQALAVLSSLALSDLVAEEAELVAVLRARERLLATRRPQVQRGVAPRQEVEALELAAREARARLQSLRAQLEARRRLGAEAEDTWRWRAPADGVVSDLRCVAGATVGSETPCVTLLDLARAELRVRAPERLLGALPADGAGALLARWRPIGHPTHDLELTLARRAPVVDPASRSLELFFRLPGRGDAPLDPALVPGASGRVELVLPAPEGLLRLPATALTRLEGAEVVFVRDPGAPGGLPAGPVAVTRIGRAGADGDDVVVRATAELPAGAPVAVRGVFLLKSLWVAAE